MTRKSSLMATTPHSFICVGISFVTLGDLQVAVLLLTCLTRLDTSNGSCGMPGHPITHTALSRQPLAPAYF